MKQDSPACTADDVRLALRQDADEERACHSRRFFKTGPGEYAEGDLFLGVNVPAQRKIARRFRHLALDQIGQLLDSPIHEERLTALFILELQVDRGTEEKRRQIVELCLERLDRINAAPLPWDASHHAAICD